ncbi:MAG: hypothetical protein EPO10_29550 [Reyranella sp.]|uniref:hypothetical protein n=1 Tax=Reyranella sp. TaxID=1929291 RepID=UPI001212FB51|nr:hypothetical protein [Reyranella sp.]TAJ92019.1 MAG: hypothetical protein EPO41_13965 [Reyranella sp.]TBR21656.1 MAG: hypothetical protein EPO10_29550 [Reyranella sp.]
MITRRRALVASGLLLAAPCAHAQDVRWADWLGTYSGTARFYRSIPLEDIVPPPTSPREEYDDGRPFVIQFTVRSVDGSPGVWLRIDSGPMQTDELGETMLFGPVTNGVAMLRSADARALPRSASLTVRPNQLGTEALFTHADGSFWRRYFTATFTPAGADVILWVFDATGTRARTWRGSTVRRV